MATDNIPIAVQSDETGSKVATRTTTEDAVTKHWERRHIHRGYIQDGGYMTHSGNLTASALGQNNTNGSGAFMYLFNPVSSGKSIYIRRVRMAVGFTAAALTPVNPTPLYVRLNTFTGTVTASALAIAKRRTTDTTAVGIPALTTTGATLGATAISIGSLGFYPNQLTAATVQTSQPTIATYRFNEGEMPVLVGGECLILQQTLAGVTSDTRKVVLEILWREVSTEF